LLKVFGVVVCVSSPSVLDKESPRESTIRFKMDTLVGYQRNCCHWSSDRRGMKRRKYTREVDVCL